MAEESNPTGRSCGRENKLREENWQSSYGDLSCSQQTSTDSQPLGPSDSGISSTVDEDCSSLNEIVYIHSENASEDTSKQAECGNSKPDEELRKKFEKEYPSSNSMTIVTNKCQIENSDRQGISSTDDEDCSSANESAHNQLEIAAKDTSEQAECGESKPDEDMGKLSAGGGVSSTGVTPETSARRPVLTNEETMQLLKLQEQTGSFSYYVLNDGEIHLHAEDEKVRQDLDSLKASFLELFGVNAEKMKVSTTGRSFNGYFSANRIGAKLEVSREVQTVGMYLNHHNVLHWVTSAHNLILRRDQPVEQSSPGAFKHGDTEVFFCLSAEQKVPASLVYYTFATNGMTSLGGRRVLHTVDIALGPVLTFPSLINSGKPVYTSTIQEGHNPCPDCGRAVDECDRNDHPKDKCRFRIGKFYDVGEKLGGVDPELYSYYKYELIACKGLLVRCQPCKRKVLAGRVVSCENRVIIHDHLSVQHNALNVLLIKPEDIREVPQAGDSGSVWVVHDTNEALAITIGRGEFEGDNCPVWVASLLKPSLEAFCFDHLSLFADDEKFEPNISSRY